MSVSGKILFENQCDSLVPAGLELEGGLVQAVYSDDERVEVAVLDRDVFEDQDPKLDLDAFFFPALDPEFVVLKRWQKKKSEYLAAYPQLDED